MATIDDIQAVERLMQTLDENPHLMEAVRSRILTRELLELPQIVARLAERVDQITGQLATLTERVDQLTERVDQLTERVDQIVEQMAQLTGRVDRMAEQMERLRDDVGVLKGFATDGLAQRIAPAIALAMGLRLTKNLNGADLSAMIDGQDLHGIAHGQLESFLLADLIMEATDGDGRTLYVAVESSYTADARDTRRAIRNAGYLTRFTGAPARAAITAVRTDWDIDELIESGAVHWYKLPERLLQGA